MDRKKELKNQYKQLKPDMGIYVVKIVPIQKMYIGYSSNLKGAMNRTKFQLELGSYRNAQLQKEWNQYGEADITISILDTLEYEKEEQKTDYTEELQLLRDMWLEKSENSEEV